MAIQNSRNQNHRPMKTVLSNARYALQDIACELGWAFSRQNYIPYDLHLEQVQQKQRAEEKKYLRYLKRGKFIETAKIGRQLHVRLTEKGWHAALRDKIRTTTALSKKGRCFLIFDIPERERIARDMLRKFLRECGFNRLQHSVWMTDRDILEPILKLLSRKKLDRWIRIIQGTLLPTSLLERLKIR